MRENGVMQITAPVTQGSSGSPVLNMDGQVVAIVDRERYLVSMLGEKAQWVRNVRAAGGRVVLKSGHREEVQLEEVPTDRRAPILRAYLQRAPGARPHVPVSKDAELPEFEKVAGAFPIFRLTSVRAPQRLRSGESRG